MEKPDLTRCSLAMILVVSFVMLGAQKTRGQSLAWDSTSRDLSAKFGEPSLQFVFSVTNVSTTNVTIASVRPSCGCTVVKMPATPWILAPGAFGKLEGTIDLRGKSGILSKSIFVDTSAGPQILATRVNIAGGPGPIVPGQDGRTANVQAALGNRQLVFQGDCARCHVLPAAGKQGAPLYEAACAICHDAENRASMVPDLHHLNHPTDRDYWLNWISHGKPATLMPAFAQSDGGPLSGEQIQSLVDALLKEVPRTAHPSVPGK